MSLSRSRSASVDAAGAEPQRADQRAVHDEVGVAPDRRGEVGVALQVEAEVADVVGGVHRLRLRAQHHLVDEIGHGQRLGPLQHAIEVAGAQLCRPGQLQVEAVEEVPEREQLLLGGRVVHPVDERGALCLQRLGGRHVGLDHELLDQAMRAEPLPAPPRAPPCPAGRAGSCARAGRGRAARAGRALRRARRRQPTAARARSPAAARTWRSGRPSMAACASS